MACLSCLVVFNVKQVPELQENLFLFFLLEFRDFGCGWSFSPQFNSQSQGIRFRIDDDDDDDSMIPHVSGDDTPMSSAAVSRGCEQYAEFVG